MPAPASEMDIFLSDLAKKFERLKILYEQYFMGIEKIEPAVLRKEVSRAVQGLQQTPLRGTGVRFKAANLIQKWNIYTSYWNRTMRDIEAGRYVRDVARARRRAEQAGVSFPAAEMGLPATLAEPHAEP